MRSTLPSTVLQGAYSYTGQTIVWTDGDAVNGSAFTPAGGELVLVRNTGAVPRTVTIQSALDSYNRERDIQEALAAGAIKAYGPFQLPGWRQNDGLFYIDVDNADLEIAVLVL